MAKNNIIVTTQNIKTEYEYKNLYKKSIKDPKSFWDEKAHKLHWFKKWNTISKTDFINGEIQWFSGGQLNASYNCIDRHIENGFGEEIAIIWEGNDPEHSVKISYNQLLKKYLNLQML